MLALLVYTKRYKPFKKIVDYIADLSVEQEAHEVTVEDEKKSEGDLEEEKVCLTIYPSIHRSICLFVHSSIRSPLSIHTLIHQSIHPYTYPSIYSSIHLSIHLFIHTLIHPYTYPSIHLSIHPCIHRPLEEKDRKLLSFYVTRHF